MPDINLCNNLQKKEGKKERTGIHAVLMERGRKITSVQFERKNSAVFNLKSERERKNTAQTKERERDRGKECLAFFAHESSMIPSKHLYQFLIGKQRIQNVTKQATESCCR